MREWVCSVTFACAVCGGLVPRYVWWEKEVFKQALLFPEAECHCPWKKRMEEQLEAVFRPSRTESLQTYYRILEREGVSLERG